MSELHLTRGLPGSGKSTHARAWTSESPETRLRVNRDDVRAMIHTKYAAQSTESNTTIVTHAAIRHALRLGRDVIVDDTNLNSGNVRSLMKIADQAGAEVVFHDFPIDVDEAIRRDAARGADGLVHPVGEQVIRSMYERYLAQHKGQLPPTPVLAERPTFAPYTGTPGKPCAVIVDVDGTLALNYGHRSPYDYSKVRDDALNKPVSDLLWHLIVAGHIPIVMSGRDDSCREDTITWIHDEVGLFDNDYVGPLMRATGDKRDDAIVKLELFDEHVRDEFDVRLVLDDRNKMVRAWRSIGLTCLQVADGDF